MKPKLWMALSVLTIVGCSAPKSSNKTSEGTVVTADFLKKYSGQFKDARNGDETQIFPGGEIKFKVTRQVGGNRSSVPFPTVCTFIEEGKILAVYKRSEERKSAYSGYADHLISLVISKLTLDNSPDAKQETPENCKKFEASQERAGHYSKYAELLSDDKFRLHTSGSGDGGFNAKGERTEGTLDEVFERVN